MSSGGTVLLTAISVTASGSRPVRLAAAFIRSRTMAMLSATGMDKTINHEGHEVTRRKAKKRFLVRLTSGWSLAWGRGRGRPCHTFGSHHGYRRRRVVGGAGTRSREPGHHN